MAAFGKVVNGVGAVVLVVTGIWGLVLSLDIITDVIGFWGMIAAIILAPITRKRYAPCGYSRRK